MKKNIVVIRHPAYFYNNETHQDEIEMSGKKQLFEFSKNLIAAIPDLREKKIIFLTTFPGRTMNAAGYCHQFVGGILFPKENTSEPMPATFKWNHIVSQLFEVSSQDSKEVCEQKSSAMFQIMKALLPLYDVVLLITHSETVLSLPNVVAQETESPVPTFFADYCSGVLFDIDTDGRYTGQAISCT